MSKTDIVINIYVMLISIISLIFYIHLKFKPVKKQKKILDKHNKYKLLPPVIIATYFLFHGGYVYLINYFICISLLLYIEYNINKIKYNNHVK